MNKPNLVCLDFDGTIMHYEDPPEHFHPDVIAALNHLQSQGVDWIANSGRTFDGQLEIIRHCMEARGLRHAPCAIISNESYIFVRTDDGYSPLTSWNEQAAEWARAMNRELQQRQKTALDALVNRHAPDGAFFREDGTVFQITASDEARALFIEDLARVLQSVPSAELINNGEWIAVIHKRLGKGNVLRAYLTWREIIADTVLAVGDHGNDLSMLDGSVTPHVACPGNAFPVVRDAVRKAGGYVASAHGPHGTLEAFQHYFNHDTTWPDIRAEENISRT